MIVCKTENGEQKECKFSDFIVSKEWSCKELKERISKVINTPVDLFRIREKFYNHFTKVIGSEDDSKSIEKLFQVNDGKDIFVQELSSPDTITSDDILVKIARLSPSNDVGPAEEVIF